MTFFKTVGAYLTGWLIVQPIYNRLFAAWRRREMARPRGLYQTQLRDQAAAIVDAMQERGGAPARTQVLGQIVSDQLGEINRLRATMFTEAQVRRLLMDGIRLASHGLPTRAAGDIADDVLARERRFPGLLGTPHPGWEKGPSGHPQLREEPEGD